jgi:mannose-6-phosphate isomerase-like protein (cupin superfamily)
MKAEDESIRELDGLLHQRFLSGLWRIPAGERPLDPKTDVKPHLWKWADVYDSLLKARDRIGIHAAVNERRTIRLVNPGLEQTEMTSHTMLFAFQLIQPGEFAPAHRHTMAAIRFILQGQGAYTAVEGEKVTMGQGDLILTPQWTWHEHGHEGAEPMVWIDGLDVPLVKALQVISFEPYPPTREGRRRGATIKPPIPDSRAPSVLGNKPPRRRFTTAGKRHTARSSFWLKPMAIPMTASRWSMSIRQPAVRPCRRFRAGCRCSVLASAPRSTATRARRYTTSSAAAAPA